MTYLSQFFHYFSGQKGAGIAVISHTEDTSPSAFAFSRPDGNSSTPAPAAGKELYLTIIIITLCA